MCQALAATFSASVIDVVTPPAGPATIKSRLPRLRFIHLNCCCLLACFMMRLGWKRSQLHAINRNNYRANAGKILPTHTSRVDTANKQSRTQTHTHIYKVYSTIVNNVTLRIRNVGRVYRNNCYFHGRAWQMSVDFAIVCIYARLIAR